MSIAVNGFVVLKKKTNFLNVDPVFKEFCSCFLQEFGYKEGDGVEVLSY